jgi:hypothetical protein
MTSYIFRTAVYHNRSWGAESRGCAEAIFDNSNGRRQALSLQESVWGSDETQPRSWALLEAYKFQEISLVTQVGVLAVSVEVSNGAPRNTL